MELKRLNWLGDLAYLRQQSPVLFRNLHLRGHVENKPRSGRKKKFTGRSDNALSRLVKVRSEGNIG
jgi:hypothetical protein